MYTTPTPHTDTAEVYLKSTFYLLNIAKVKDLWEMCKKTREMSIWGYIAWLASSS